MGKNILRSRQAKDDRLDRKRKSLKPNKLKKTEVSLNSVFNAPDEGADKIDKKATKLIEQTELVQVKTRLFFSWPAIDRFIHIFLQKIRHLTDEEAGAGLENVNANTSRALIGKCDWFPPPVCDRRVRYRSASGACNNLLPEFTPYGAATTPYQRILLATYNNGNRRLPAQREPGGGRRGAAVGAPPQPDGDVAAADGARPAVQRAADAVRPVHRPRHHHDAGLRRRALLHQKQADAE